MDPVVFFKPQLVMFFEDLRSERRLMRVVADRISLRRYLGYDLFEPPPDHPSLTRILVLTDGVSRPYPGLPVVPDYCVATLDRRTLPGETEDVLSPVREAAGRAIGDTGATGDVSVAVDDFESYARERVTAPDFAPARFFDETAEVVRSAPDALDRAGLPGGSPTTPSAQTAAARPEGSASRPAASGPATGNWPTAPATSCPTPTRSAQARWATPP